MITGRESVTAVVPLSPVSGNNSGGKPQRSEVAIDDFDAEQYEGMLEDRERES